jgi:hypothetical protein
MSLPVSYFSQFFFVIRPLLAAAAAPPLPVVDVKILNDVISGLEGLQFSPNWGC